jgi:hypothetical protein
MFTLCFIIEIFSLSIFTFVHHYVAHSTVLSIILFHYVSHVLISSKCMREFNLVLSLGCFKDFLLFRNFFLVCLKLTCIQSWIPRCLVWYSWWQFYFCHWSRKVLRLQAHNWGTKDASKKYPCKQCKLVVEWKRMQFHCASCQGVERVNENKIKFKMVRCS